MSARYSKSLNTPESTHGQWLGWNDSPTYAGSTSFTVAGDLPSRYIVGRRIWMEGTSTSDVYGTILTSSYSCPNTTVTVVWDSGSLSNETLSVWLSVHELATCTIAKTIIGGYNAGNTFTVQFNGELQLNGPINAKTYTAQLHGEVNFGRRSCLQTRSTKPQMKALPPQPPTRMTTT